MKRHRRQIAPKPEGAGCVRVKAPQIDLQGTLLAVGLPQDVSVGGEESEIVMRATDLTLAGAEIQDRQSVVVIWAAVARGGAVDQRVAGECKAIVAAAVATADVGLHQALLGLADGEDIQRPDG